MLQRISATKNEGKKIQKLTNFKLATMSVCELQFLLKGALPSPHCGVLSKDFKYNALFPQQKNEY